MVEMNTSWSSKFRDATYLMVISYLFPSMWILGTEGGLWANVAAWLLWSPLQVVTTYLFLFHMHKQFNAPRMTSSDLATALERALGEKGHSIVIVDNHARRENWLLRQFLFDYIIKVHRGDDHARIHLEEIWGHILTGPGERAVKFTIVFVGPITKRKRAYVEGIKEIIEWEVRTAPLSRRILRRGTEDMGM